MHTITRVVESYAEFAERHGSRPVLVGSRFVFSSGAYVDREDSNRRAEPSEDTFTRLALQRAYIVARLEKEEAAFFDFRESTARRLALAQEFPDSVRPPADNAVAQLEAGAKRIAGLREELEKVVAALDLTDEVVAGREVRRREGERQAALSAMERQIANVTL